MALLAFNPDLALVAGDGTKVPARKSVLVEKSPHFRRMLEDHDDSRCLRCLRCLRCCAVYAVRQAKTADTMTTEDDTVRAPVLPNGSKFVKTVQPAAPSRPNPRTRRLVCLTARPRG